MLVRKEGSVRALVIVVCLGLSLVPQARADQSAAGWPLLAEAQRYHLSPEPGRPSPYFMLALNDRPGLTSEPEAVNPTRASTRAGSTAGPMPRSGLASGWTGGNWICSLLAAEGFGIVGGLALGGFAYLIVKDRFKETGDGEAVDKQFALEVMAVAASHGFALGAAAGARLYGRSTERSDGSYGAAFLGSTMGLVLAGMATGATWKNKDLCIATSGLLFSTLPALGATLGYFASSSAPQPHLAPVQYDPRTGISLGLPTVMLSRSNAVSTVSVPVAAGYF